ncbi:MAG: SCP2 sterol-binding domain-containing protein [Thalassotalea sp.]|nr:SCP2 sterol-binding domain-containing protein [Thalassotalea sp.]
MHPQLFCSVVESIANGAISLSPATKEKLPTLDEKRLAVHLQELGFSLVISQGQGKLLITSPSEDAIIADCTISTSVSALKELKNEQQLTALIKADKLDIEGDMKVAQQFASLADSFDIDWPAELEKHIGDIATHKLITLGKKASTKAEFVKTQISSDASEYVVYEQQLVVTQPEIQGWVEDIDEVTKQSATIEQQIAQLTERLSRLTSQ